ncbi:hypothetical protein [Pontibacter sp. SGAir0037]|uniref:hypothetical protein n=1 Tax=Pontibacter sp. SGAir0037 TaxID=2571030 RepID=UPI0010CD2AEB|nr:hypothetical protein [Pontibacter sp. SGAir0037]QCR23769.1 hypothetical protein C1N53_16385 [Pontibacter sp. SGAir0037]
MEEDKEITKSVRLDEKDWFLQSLVRTVTGTDHRIGMTFLTGGLLVSGYVVSGHKYFEAIAKLYSSKEEVQQSIANLAEGYLPNESGEILAMQDLPAFIHLQDAKYYNTFGQPIPGKEGVWWRGTLLNINGYNFGVLGFPSRDDQVEQ